MNTVTFDVAGTTCGRCVARVERALRELEGVSEVRMDMARGQAVVTFDAAVVAASRIEAASVRAGYPARTATAALS